MYECVVFCKFEPMHLSYVKRVNSNPPCGNTIRTDKNDVPVCLARQLKA